MLATQASTTTIYGERMRKHTTLYENKQEVSEAWTEFCNAVKETWKLDTLLDWLLSKMKFLKRRRR